MADRFAHTHNPFIFDDDDDTDSDDDEILSEHQPFSDSDSSSSSSGDSSDSSSDDPCPPTPTESDDSDSDYKPRHYVERKRLGMLAYTKDSDPDDVRFRVHLRQQHLLRIQDSSFAALESSPLSLARWRKWRRWFFRSYFARRIAILEDVSLPRLRGVSVAGAAVPASRQKITVYRALAACLNNPMVLMQTIFARIAGLDALTPVALAADGVGEVTTKCPGAGKVYGLYFKPLSLIRPQSPQWLIPWLISFSSDCASVLHRVFADASTKTILQFLQRKRYGDATESNMTSLVLFFIGDFPACYSTLQLATPARQWPSTAGRVALWCAAMCWHCGAGGGEMYHRGNAWPWRHDRAAQIRRLQRVATSLGIPSCHVFYDPVHAICVVTQSLLCDIAIYYQKLHSNHLHPVAAFIFGLFGTDTWDPFLVRAETRKAKRRSAKPYYANDPADVFMFIFDPVRMSLLLALLQRHNVPWTLSALPAQADRVSSPLHLVQSALAWIDAYVSGDAAAAACAAARVEDQWLHMNTLFAPPAADRPCAMDAPPSFVPQITAWGPASHVALCSSYRYIRFVDRTLPHWRESGHSFIKIACTVFLEHGMGSIRRDFADFAIQGRLRSAQPLELLMRQVELCLLRTVTDFKSQGQDDDVEEKPRSSAKERNSAYDGIPLSKRIAAHLLHFGE